LGSTNDKTVYFGSVPVTCSNDMPKESWKLVYFVGQFESKNKIQQRDRKSSATLVYEREKNGSKDAMALMLIPEESTRNGNADAIRSILRAVGAANMMSESAEMLKLPQSLKADLGIASASNSVTPLTTKIEAS